MIEAKTLTELRALSSEVDQYLDLLARNPRPEDYGENRLRHVGGRPVVRWTWAGGVLTSHGPGE